MTLHLCIGTHQETARKVFLENPGLLADVGVGIMTENILSSVEKFICRLYGVTQTPSVDVARQRLLSGEESQKIWHPQAMHCHSM